MYLVINKWVTAVKVSNFSGHYLRNRSTLDIGVLGYIGIVNIRNTLPKSRTFLLGHPVYSCMGEGNHCHYVVFLVDQYIFHISKVLLYYSLETVISQNKKQMLHVLWIGVDHETHLIFLLCHTHKCCVSCMIGFWVAVSTQRRGKMCFCGMK